MMVSSPLSLHLLRDIIGFDLWHVPVHANKCTDVFFLNVWRGRRRQRFVTRNHLAGMSEVVFSAHAKAPII